MTGNPSGRHCGDKPADHPSRRQIVEKERDVADVLSRDKTWRAPEDRDHAKLVGAVPFDECDPCMTTVRECEGSEARSGLAF
jgi:hypothetical protein